MAPPSLTYLLDNVATSTMEHRLPGLVDNFFKSNPFAQRLLQRGEDHVQIQGGRDIRQRIIYSNKPSSWYQGLDPLPTDQKETRTEAIFNWKQHNVPVVLSGLDLLKNAGPEAISDLVQDEMDEAEMTFADELGTGLFGDGLTAKTLTGLRAVCDDGTLVATYGGITRSSTAGSPGLAVSSNVSTTATAFSLSAMNTFMQGTGNGPTIGSEKPDLILTTQTIWNKFWERSQPSQRFAATDANKPINIGFPQIDFNGAAVVVDSHCASGSVYFLNTKWLKLVVHSKRFASFTDWMYPTNQDSAIKRLYFAGELVCKAPRLQGLATAVS
jgi:hypothetical protein